MDVHPPSRTGSASDPSVADPVFGPAVPPVRSLRELDREQEIRRLRPAEERRIQEAEARAATQPLGAPLVGEADVVPGMGKLAGVALGAGRLAGRQAAGLAAKLIPRAVADSPTGRRIVDFVVEHAGKEAGFLRVALDHAQKKAGVEFFTLAPELRASPQGRAIVRDVFEELRRRLPDTSATFDRVSGSQLSRAGERGFSRGFTPQRPFQ